MLRYSRVTPVVNWTELAVTTVVIVVHVALFISLLILLNIVLLNDALLNVLILNVVLNTLMLRVTWMHTLVLKILLLKVLLLEVLLLEVLLLKVLFLKVLLVISMGSKEILLVDVAARPLVCGSGSHGRVAVVSTWCYHFLFWTCLKSGNCRVGGHLACT